MLKWMRDHQAGQVQSPAVTFPAQTLTFESPPPRFTPVTAPSSHSSTHHRPNTFTTPVHTTHVVPSTPFESVSSDASRRPKKKARAGSWVVQSVHHELAHPCRLPRTDTIMLQQKKKIQLEAADTLSSFFTHLPSELAPCELPAYDNGSEWLVPVRISFSYSGVAYVSVVALMRVPRRGLETLMARVDGGGVVCAE